MINKYYEKTKQYIKENFGFLFFLLVSILVLLWPVDYYILTGGGTMDIDSKIKMEDAYKNKGALYFAYVKETKGTITSYLLSYVMPGWSREPVEDFKINDDEDLKDLNFRNTLDLKLSNDHAIQLAFTKANKKYEITKSSYYVYYKDEKAVENELKVGDQILEYDDYTIETFDQFKEYISSKKEGDRIRFKVKTDNKEQIKYATLYEKDDTVFCGISLVALHDYKIEPKVELQFKNSESGPSGGLMLTLAIYNKLVKDDITNGLNIVGTGSIDEAGNVIAIGGVTYKLKGAVSKKADVFIVPKGENYDDAVKEKKKYKYDIKIIGVSTFDEALEELKKLKSE